MRLQGREVDTLFAGDVHTLENDIQEMSETKGMVSNIATSYVFRRACECGSFRPTVFAHNPTTGTFFWFGGAYFRSQVVYAGLLNLVLCALRGKRHGECRDLSMLPHCRTRQQRQRECAGSSNDGGLSRQITATAAPMSWRQQQHRVTTPQHIQQLQQHRRTSAAAAMEGHHTTGHVSNGTVAMHRW